MSVKNGLDPKAAPDAYVSQISQACVPSLLHPLNLPNPAACANPDPSPEFRTSSFRKTSLAAPPRIST